MNLIAHSAVYFVNSLLALVPCLYWAVTFTITSVIILPRFLPTLPIISKVFQSRSPEKQREICQTTVCCVHAFLAVLNSARAIFLEGILNYKDLYSFSPVALSLLHISGGYFISDTIMLCSYSTNYVLAIDDKKAHPPEGRPRQFIIHHVMCLIGIALVLKNPLALWFMMMRLLTEIPNIFLNLLILLDLYRLEQHWCSEVVRDMLYYSFLAVRPVIVMKLWKGTFYHMSTAEFWSLDWPILTFWLCCGLVLDFLNMTWLIEMTKDFYIRKFTKKVSSS